MQVAKESPYFTAGFGLMVGTPIFGGDYVSSSRGEHREAHWWVSRMQFRDCHFSNRKFLDD